MQPYINKMLNSLCEIEKRRLFLILFMLFSVQSVITDPYHMNAGFSVAWITVLYILGNLMNRLKLFEKFKLRHLWIMYFMAVIVSWIPIICFRKTVFTSCLSPTIVIQGMVLVEVFSRISKVPSFITKASPLAFGVYLFHENNYIRKIIISDKFAFINNYNLIKGCLALFGYAFLIFVLGLFIDNLRGILFKLIKIEDFSNSFCKYILEKGRKICNRIVE